MATNPRYSRKYRVIDSDMLSYEVTYDVSFSPGCGLPDTYMWVGEDCKYHFNYMPEKIKYFMDKNGSVVLT